jgi:receptor expression-enhancing protein 1/2/3/4
MTELGGGGTSSVPMPGMSSGSVYTSSRTSSESDMRERTVSGGRFEEIEVPSDVEGYYAGGGGAGEGGGGGGSVSGSAGRPESSRRTSWFGWGGHSKEGYERVKSE